MNSSLNLIHNYLFGLLVLPPIRLQRFIYLVGRWLNLFTKDSGECNRIRRAGYYGSVVEKNSQV